MPVSRFPAAEGAGVSLVGGGVTKDGRETSATDNTSEMHLHGRTHATSPAQLTSYISGTAAEGSSIFFTADNTSRMHHVDHTHVEFTKPLFSYMSGTLAKGLSSFLPSSRDAPSFKRKSRAHLVRVPPPRIPFLRVQTLCCFLVACCCISPQSPHLSATSPPPTNASIAPFSSFPAGFVPADAAESGTIKEPGFIAAKDGSSPATEDAVSSSTEKPAETPAEKPAVSASKSQKITPSSTGASLTSRPRASHEAAAELDIINSSATRSSLLLQQAANVSTPLPAGYQTYKEMMTTLKNLAQTSCPELKVTQRRNGDVKLDVLTIARESSSSSGENSGSSEDNSSSSSLETGSSSSGDDGSSNEDSNSDTDNSSSNADSSSESAEKPQHRVFILTGEHPRELLPSEVLLRFVQQLCGAHAPAAAPGDAAAAASDDAGAAASDAAATAAPPAVAVNNILVSDASSPAVARQVREMPRGEGTEVGNEEQPKREEGETEKRETEERELEGGETEDAAAAGEKEGEREKTQTGESSSSSLSGSNGSETTLDQQNQHDSDRYKRLLNSTEFQIILNANPLGRERVEAGEYCRRGTLNGVDINRNWDAFWMDTTQAVAAGSSAVLAAGGGGGGGEEKLTGGPSPFSEPETQLVKQELEKFRPTLFVSMHSGSLGVYTPYGYADEQPVVHATRLREVASRLARSALCKNVDNGTRCDTGTAGQYFAAHGNCVDWAYTTIKPTPFAFLLEIYKGQGQGRGEPSSSSVPELPTITPATTAPDSPTVEEAARDDGKEKREKGGGGDLSSSFVDTELPSQAPPSSFSQFSSPAGTAGGVRTPQKAPSTEQKLFIRQLLSSRRYARISPHVYGTSFVGKTTKLQPRNSASVAAGGQVKDDDNDSITPIADRTASHSSFSGDRGNRAEINPRNVERERFRPSFLESTAAAASAAAHAAAAEQAVESQYTAQECFEVFNPRNPQDREKTINNWTRLLLELIEETQGHSEEAKSQPEPLLL